MINFTDMTGLAGSTIAITAMAMRLPVVSRLHRPYLAGLAALVAIVVLIPFGGLPLAAYVRGVTGDLSISSLLLLALALARPLSGWSPLNAKARTALLLFIVIVAAVLYPLALGVGFFDPYRLGYGSPWLLGGLLLLALAAWARQLPVIALAIALAVLAWGAGWYESTNLWDYLLDPLLAIYAISALLKRAVQALLRSQRG